MITLIDVFTVAPARQQALVDVEIQAAAVVKQQPGYISTTIHRSPDGTRVVNYTQFASHEAFEVMLQSPEMHSFMQQAKSIADAYDPVLYETAYTDTASLE